MKFPAAVRQSNADRKPSKSEETPPVRGVVPAAVSADRNRGITRVLGTPTRDVR